MKRVFTGWESLVALVCGTLAAFRLPGDFYAQAASELVTVLGLFMAAFVPAMMLAATALRAGGFSVRTIRSLAAGIDRQIAVFGGLFLYALLACIVVVIGTTVDWDLPTFGTGVSYVPQIALSKLFPFMLTFLLVLLTCRSLTVIAGVRSVLQLTATIAEDEARERDKVKEQEAADELTAYRMPPTYGAKIDLPRPPH